MSASTQEAALRSMKGGSSIACSTRPGGEHEGLRHSGNGRGPRNAPQGAAPRGGGVTALFFDDKTAALQRPPSHLEPVRAFIAATIFIVSTLTRVTRVSSSITFSL